MSRATVTAVQWAAILVVLACGRQPPPGDVEERSSVAADTASDTALAVDTPSAQRPTIRPGAPSKGQVESRPIPVPPGKKQTSVLSVGEVVGDASLAGTIITVRGTCLRRGAGKADGAPPLTRSDWELGSGTQALWVSGSRPVGCPAESGATDSSLAKGLVQVDTLRMFDGTERVRVYLVLEP